MPPRGTLNFPSAGTTRQDSLRVVSLALHPAGSHHDACLRELQIGRVEEEDLADLGVKGIDAEGANRRPMIRRRDGQLELHGVGVPDQPEQLSELLVRELLVQRWCHS